MQRGLTPLVWLVNEYVLVPTVRGNSLDRVDFSVFFRFADFNEGVGEGGSASFVFLVHVDSFLDEKSFKVEVGFGVGNAGVDCDVKEVSVHIVSLIDVSALCN